MPTIATGLFVDTSGWAEPLLQTSPDRVRMAAIYRQAIDAGRPLITTNYVFAELVVLLTARTRASRAHLLATLAAIKRLPTLRVVHMDLDLYTSLIDDACALRRGKVCKTIVH